MNSVSKRFRKVDLAVKVFKIYKSVANYIVTLACYRLARTFDLNQTSGLTEQT